MRNADSTRGLDRKALSLFPLVLTLFCLVSGGPYGLEGSVQAAGPGMALLLILVLPLIWAYPVALMTAELTAAIPEEGGYYAWATRALGPFWGFQTGWWTWLYAMTDAAIYPVIFMEYLATFIETWTGSNPFAGNLILRLAVTLAVILFFTALNIRGTRVVGRSSIILGLALIAPFVVLVAIGLVRMLSQPGPIPTSMKPPETGFFTAFSTGMAIVMWNYLGWDTLSTVTEEVDRPERTFPRALLLCVPLVTAIYVLPVVVGLRFVPNIAAWEDGNWPNIAREIGGDALGFWVNVAGLLSPLALFMAAMLGATRIPFVLAADGYLPKRLGTLHPRFGTPWLSILVCAAIFAVLAAHMSFRSLVELNVMLYAASLMPELISLVVLRIREPELPRPYRIPGGWPGVLAVALLPMVVSLVAFIASILDPSEGWADQVPVLALLASGPIVYLALGGRRRAA